MKAEDLTPGAREKRENVNAFDFVHKDCPSKLSCEIRNIFASFLGKC